MVLSNVVRYPVVEAGMSPARKERLGPEMKFDVGVTLTNQEAVVTDAYPLNYSIDGITVLVTDVNKVTWRSEDGPFTDYKLYGTTAILGIELTATCQRSLISQDLPLLWWVDQDSGEK